MELLGREERYQEAEQDYQQFLLALAELGPTKDGHSREPDPRTRDIREYLLTKQLQRQRVQSPTMSVIEAANNARGNATLSARLSTEVLERKQVQELIHTPLGPHILGAWFVPLGALVNPVSLVQGIGEAAARYGAIPVAAEVLQLSPDGEGIRLQTTQGILHAGRVIVALNAWTSELLPQLKEIITPVRGQVLAYQPLPPFFSTGITVDLAGSEQYWQQTPNGTILLGGCRSVAEGKDVGVRSSQPTEAVQHALEQVFPHLFPHLSGLHVAQRWAGLMAFTPDELPIADRVPDLPHAWVVGGFCGHGMPFGVRFGQLLAEAVTQNLTPSALLPFRLNRDTLK
jgi:gamma-glutamylputrescine oxidase